ncbi:hypothetical protein ACNKHU_16240 [Shigella flexneri]
MSGCLAVKVCHADIAGSQDIELAQSALRTPDALKRCIVKG